MFIISQLRELGVPVRVTLGPIGRWKVVGGNAWRVVGIVIALSCPSDPTFGEGVGLTLITTSAWVEELDACESVYECRIEYISQSF
jgi:hypothetical protein